MNFQATRIKIVGAGLLGASLGLALSRAGIQPALSDSSASNLRLAVDYGAGRAAQIGEQFALVVVAVPPDFVSGVVGAELRANPEALVTDLASVKSEILQQVQSENPEAVGRYLGSHPMAGRERGGPSMARTDLFFGRPWVVTPHESSPAQALNLVEQLALAVGASPVRMSTVDHDSAVALVSHLPQLLSSLLAGELTNADSAAIALAGQGLRDVTRIAASDPGMWLQILTRNEQPLLPLVTSLRERIQELESVLCNLDAPGSLSRLNELLARGNEGVARIPGKHGGKFADYATVVVLVDDSPGELARLLNAVGDWGINLEDLALEHSPGAAIGLAELQVLPEKADELVRRLSESGWRLA